ncbi:MAG: ABC transporter ATP-binding protein [Parcubacteria group bacterium]|nr:ABC transporter ATP-binding protein [Parcubacteria group bacterium]
MEEVERVPPANWREYLSKYRDTWSVLRWVWNELMTPRARKWAITYTVLSGCSLLIFTLQPLVFAWLVNGVSSRSLQLVLVGFGAFASLALLQQGSSLLHHLVREWVINRNTLQLHDRLNELFYEKVLGQHSQDSRLNYASIEKAKGRVHGLQEMMLFETVQVMLSVLLSLGLMWYLTWEIALVLTLLLFAHIGWSVWLNYHVAVVTTPIEQEFRAQNRQMIERWEKIVRVKTSGKGRAEQERLSTWFNRILELDRKFWFWFIRQSTYRELSGHIVRLLTIGYGVYLVYIGEQEIGFLMPLYTWVTQSVQNMWYFGHAERRINEQIPRLQAMRDALTTPALFSEESGEKVTSEKPIKIRFENVGLCYGEDGGKEIPTLRNISFSIAPGEKVALIGPSGAGKSSIMKLLLRFMDPSEGEIWVNGHQLKDVELVSWMEHVGYIPQDSQVFDGTIRYNLTFGLPERRQETIKDEEIWDVMRLLKIDFGDRLVEGLNTVVGRDGMKLSGGERQRLIAGAAVIKRPIFMIIDEATSSLDSTTEKEVQKGLQEVLSGPCGALIVAHRLSTVRTICDRFVVLRKLEDTPEGESQIEAIASSFEELYRISPTFKQLADDQGIKV